MTHGAGNTQPESQPKPVATRPISHADYQALAQSGTTAFVCLPNRLTVDRPRAFGVLDRIIQQTANVGLESVQRFGTRYVTATYDTAEHRDQAIEVLARESVMVKDTAYPVIAEAFGNIKRSRNRVQ